MTKALLCELLCSLLEDVIKTASELISGILFEEHAMPDFFQKVYGIFLGIACSMMICIILYKIIQYMLDMSNGMQQITLGEIITRSVKASIMIVIAPFILNIAVNYVVYPIGQYAFAEMSNEAEEQNSNLKVSAMNFSANIIHFNDKTEDKGVIETVKDTASDYLEMEKSNFIFVLIFGFITVTVSAYFIKMCIFQADLIWLNILSVKAAISMCADDNNYMGVWWREMLSQVTSIVVQTFSMVGVIKIINSDNFSWYNLMLVIGMGVIVIKGPNVLRNMWYSTGSGKSLMAATKVAARKFLLKG